MGVGALLVVVAVGVFTAVTWSALGPAGQALVLMATTAGAAAATVLLAGRGLRASAEAVGVVSAALALATFEGARDLLLTGWDPWLAWAVGCGVVALSLAALALSARVRAPMIVALFLVQWCVPLVLAGSTPPVLVVALAFLWLAVADVVLATALAGREPTVAALAGGFGALAWLVSLGVAVVLLFLAPGQAAIASTLIAGAAAAVAVSSPPSLRSWWSVAAGCATVATVLAGIGTALVLGAGVEFWLPTAVLAGAVGVWLPTRSDDRLVAVRWVAGASALLLSAVELARAAVAACGPLIAEGGTGLGWSATGQDPFASARAADLFGGDPTMTLLGLIAATGLLVRWPQVALAVGALTIAAAGALLDLPVAAIAVVGVLLGVGLGLAFVVDRRVPATAGVIGLVLSALAVGWATVVAPGLVLGTLLVVLVAGVAAVVLATNHGGMPEERRTVVLFAGLIVVWLTGVGVALSFGVTLGWGPASVWLLTVAAAMIGSLAGFVFDDRDPSLSMVSDLCAVTAILVSGGAAIAVGGADGLSLVLVGATATALAHTFRPGRFWPAATVAAAAGVSLVWLRLGMAGVEWPEAYGLSVAVVLGLLGWTAHRRGHHGGSWLITGPALLAAMVPSTVEALGAPGEPRALLVIAAAVGLLVAGVTLRWKAPVVIGAVIATTVGLVELGPTIDRLPRWAVLASLGLTLIVVGARIEEGKRGMARLAGRISSMW